MNLIRQNFIYLIGKPRAPLQVITVPVDTPRVNYLSRANSADPSQAISNPKHFALPPTPPSSDVGVPRIKTEEVEFQVACMKRLDGQSQFVGQNDKITSQNDKSGQNVNTVKDQLKLHNEEYPTTNYNWRCLKYCIRHPLVVARYRPIR